MTSFELVFTLVTIVTPESSAERKVDLVDFHYRERCRYILAAIVIFGLALISNAAFGGVGFYSAWLRDSAFSIAGLVIAPLAYFFSAPGIQVLSAAALALPATYYAVITCNVVAA